MSMRVPTPYLLPSPCAWKGSWSTVWNHTLQSMSKLLCTYKKNCLIPFPAYLSSSISHSLGTHVCTYTHTSPHYHAVFCLYASCTSARNSFFPKNLFKTQLRYRAQQNLPIPSPPGEVSEIKRYSTATKDILGPIQKKPPTAPQMPFLGWIPAKAP